MVPYPIFNICWWRINKIVSVHFCIHTKLVFEYLLIISAVIIAFLTMAGGG